MKISIVIPCLNCAPYLRECLQSIVCQPKDVRELIFMDGGSTDGSLAIAADFRAEVSHFRTGSDSGQYDAINKGFSLATGEIFAWLNADDLYLPWTLQSVAEIFEQCPEVQWLTSRFPMHASERTSGPVAAYYVKDGPSRLDIQQGLITPGHRYARGVLQQESTFWRRSLWDKAGGRLDTTLSLAADAELWLRFARHADLHLVPIPLASFRIRSGQRSEIYHREYRNQAQGALMQSGVRSIGFSRYCARVAGAALNRHIAVRLRLVPRVPSVQYDHTTGQWRVRRT